MLCTTAKRAGGPSPSENLNLVKAWSLGGSFFFFAKCGQCFCGHQAGLATQQNNVELEVESWRKQVVSLFFNAVEKCNHCSKAAAYVKRMLDMFFVMELFK